MKKILAITSLLALLVAGVTYSTSKTVHSLRVTDDGSLVASVKGGNSTNLPVHATGVYTPEYTGLVNMGAVTHVHSYWVRDGNYVTIHGYASSIITAANVDTSFDFSIPPQFEGENFTGNDMFGHGTVWRGVAGTLPGAVFCQSVTGSTRARVRTYRAPSASTSQFFYTCVFEIKK